MRQIQLTFLAWLMLWSMAARGDPQLSLEMVQVPYDAGDATTQQPNGPEYSYSMGRFEITVSQYITFLNNAEANQGNERGANLAFRTWGDVGLPRDNTDNSFVFRN